MKRKINQVGTGTYTISLPMKWVKDRGLGKGDEVELVEYENILTLVSGEMARKTKEYEINIDELDYFTLAKLLITCFEEGYDTIILVFKKNNVHDSVLMKDVGTFDAINKLVERLVTFEITSQLPNKIIVSDISEKLVKFDIIMSRIFFLIEEYLRLLIDDIKNKNLDDLNARESRHDAVTKYIALACRILNEGNKKSQTEKSNLFLILNYLDKTTDFIRYCYKYTKEFDAILEKQSIELMEKTLEYLQLFRSLFSKFGFAKINKLDVLRRDVKNLYCDIYSKSPNELLVISHLNCMVEMLNGAVKSRIALDLKN